jgi:uncharacterized protein YjbJ (UPF0337 family)
MWVKSESGFNSSSTTYLISNLIYLKESQMSVEDRAEAIAKNIEGKIQEAASELTGDPKDKVEGQAKQDEAAAIHAREDIKDKAKEIIDRA